MIVVNIVTTNGPVVSIRESKAEGITYMFKLGEDKAMQFRGKIG